ncbi:hypothetical protein PMZ80_010928 [Knufia obscura]|uniref:RecA family profile 1 domain-containing protein n=1 Tax=Knufia obscura TaxID=1635080 RepID=A0ABR0R854_9EURO|nr:hypothetical protein PMZ80_010928 [Knufia obscura]
MDDQDSSDYHNFSQISSSAHRLPTLNGAEALLDAIEKHKPISTSLTALDATLCSTDEALSDNGGLPRGRLTEIYGAPGCGKTHFAIQLAANALREDDAARVVWVDTSAQLPYAHLKQFLEAPQRGQEGEVPITNGVEDHEQQSADERLDHLYVSSFPHLMAVLLHPSQDFPPSGTTLLVVDNLSNIAMIGLPQSEKVSNSSAATNGSLSREDIISKSIAARRGAMLSAISAGLARVAASRNIAIVVTNSVSSHRKYGGKNSVLRSALNVQQWNENVSNRIVIYRELWPATHWASLDREEARKQRIRERWPLRVVEVEKLNGKEVSAEGIKFVILKNRLHAVEPPKPITITNIALPSSPPLPGEDNEEAMGNLGLEDAEEAEDQSMRMPEDVTSSAAQASIGAKRKIDEVADSEDEEELEIGTAARPPPVPRGHAGFLPSSQLAQEDVEGAESTSPQRGTVGKERRGADDLDDDMLLQN